MYQATLTFFVCLSAWFKYSFFPPAINTLMYPDPEDRIFVAFVEDNATMSSIRYFENHASYYVQNRRK